MLARLGGGEFAVLLRSSWPPCGEPDATAAREPGRIAASAGIGIARLGPGSTLVPSCAEPTRYRHPARSVVAPNCHSAAASLAAVVHMRIVAPRDRVDDAMELLCATDSVCNVIPECNSDLPERGARLRLTRLPWLSACCRARPSGTRRSGRRRRRPGGRPQPRASRSARLCRELMPSLK